MQLRDFLATIGCISVSITFNISNAHLALTEEGEPSHTEEVNSEVQFNRLRPRYYVIYSQFDPNQTNVEISDLVSFLPLFGPPRKVTKPI